MSDVKTASHQTITLSPGRHRGPDDGACAMELASMLAGEPFSDHPESVCPVIGGFLRSYNDHVDTERRQDLYRYAARAVGTRGDASAERQRAEICRQWARALGHPPALHVRILYRLLRCQGADVDGVYAARAASAMPRAHRRALDLLDELIAVGRDPVLVTLSAPETGSVVPAATGAAARSPGGAGQPAPPGSESGPAT